MDAIVASSSLPILFPPYLINETYYYDGGFCNNCPVDTVDELFTIAFDLTFRDEVSHTPVKLLDLLMCLTHISNASQNKYTNIYRILDPRFNNEFMNINQTRDDIFNLYMNGYHNAKEILFKNHIALK
jgi:predicted acylesterase/phospholipase RssA